MAIKIRIENCMKRKKAKMLRAFKKFESAVVIVTNNKEYIRFMDDPEDGSNDVPGLGVELKCERPWGLHTLEDALKSFQQVVSCPGPENKALLEAFVVAQLFGYTASTVTGIDFLSLFWYREAVNYLITSINPATDAPYISFNALLAMESRTTLSFFLQNPEETIAFVNDSVAIDDLMAIDFRLLRYCIYGSSMTLYSHFNTLQKQKASAGCHSNAVLSDLAALYSTSAGKERYLLMCDYSLDIKSKGYDLDAVSQLSDEEIKSTFIDDHEFMREAVRMMQDWSDEDESVCSSDSEDGVSLGDALNSSLRLSKNGNTVFGCPLGNNRPGLPFIVAPS